MQTREEEKVVSFIDENYKSYWMFKIPSLQASIIRLGYLLENHLGDVSKYGDGDSNFLLLLQEIKTLVDKSEHLNIAINKGGSSPYINISIAWLAKFAATKRLFEGNHDRESQLSILELVSIILKKTTYVVGYSFYYHLNIDQEVAQNEAWYQRGFISHTRHYLDALFHCAVAELNADIVQLILDYNEMIKSKRHAEWFRKLGFIPKRQLVFKSTVAIKSIPSKKLIKKLHKEFPLRHFETQLDVLFFCSNEAYFDKTFTKIELIEKWKKKFSYPPEDEEIKTALIFGESNALSFLPTLLYVSQVVVFADIDPRQHAHIKHMLTCLQKSKNRKQFWENYSTKNPLLTTATVVNKTNGAIATRDMLERAVKSKVHSPLYFLHSKERFIKCKQAAAKLEFAYIGLDLSNPLQCTLLARLFKAHKAKLTLCNFTNIHHYLDANTLALSVNALLSEQKKDKPLIMYAKGEITALTATVTRGTGPYFFNTLGIKEGSAPSPKAELQGKKYSNL